MSRSALSSLGLIDTPPEAVFDSFTVLASRLLKAPVSLVSLIDAEGDRQYFKSQLGLPEPWATTRQTPLSLSFCKKVVEAGRPLIVCDSRQDERVRGNPLIDMFGISAYMGVPIFGPDDVPIGSFCVIERKSRVWTAEERDTLERLATQISTQIRMRALLQDVEESQASLSREKEYLDGLLETMPAGVLTMDDDGLIVLANQRSRDILGIGADEIAGRPFDASDWRPETLDGHPLPNEALPCARAQMDRALIKDMRYAIHLPDGSRRTVSVSAMPTRRAAHGPSVTCIISDITEQLAAEAEVQEGRIRAEAASRAKSIFLANMSHEIRTPLNGIIGMADVLANTSLSAEQTTMLSIIRSSGDLLLGVINDILDLARIEEGKLSLAQASFEPAQLLDRVAAQHKTVAADKGIALEMTLGRGLTDRRIGDEGRIAQVIGNVVGNAIEFTEAGHVHISARAVAESGLVITVTDTGIGMTPEQLHHVFSEFEQADGSITRRFGGTGLGLPIVHRLVMLMGGQITLSSVVGHGTELEITLPLPLENVAGLDPAQDNPSFFPVPQGLRVLVAEDNRVNTLILKMMLEALHVQATFVVDGREACEKWLQEPFDLLIFDISMPVMDGVTAFREIEDMARAEGREMPPVIASTANVMRGQVAHYLATGFAGVLAKPYRKSDLRRRISDALRAAEGCVEH